MTDELLTARLVGEAEDLLTVSAVGLYELRWILRGVAPHLDPESIARIASAALVELRTRGFGLGWFAWPEDEPRFIEVNPRLEGDDAWSDPRRGELYLALVPK